MSNLEYYLKSAGEVYTIAEPTLSQVVEKMQSELFFQDIILATVYGFFAFICMYFMPLRGALQMYRVMSKGDNSISVDNITVLYTPLFLSVVGFALFLFFRVVFDFGLDGRNIDYLNHYFTFDANRLDATTPFISLLHILEYVRDMSLQFMALVNVLLLAIFGAYTVWVFYRMREKFRDNPMASGGVAFVKIMYIGIICITTYYGHSSLVDKVYFKESKTLVLGSTPYRVKSNSEMTQTFISHYRKKAFQMQKSGTSYYENSIKN
jgi:hypothetical protein